MISKRLFDLVRQKVKGKPLESGDVKIEHVTSPVRPRKLRRTSLMPSGILASLLRRYIPASVVPYISANLCSWIGELRIITVLFCNLQASFLTGKVRTAGVQKLQVGTHSVGATTLPRRGEEKSKTVDAAGLR